MPFFLYEHPRSGKILGPNRGYLVVLGVAVELAPDLEDCISYLVVDALVHEDHFVETDYGVSPRFVPASSIALYVGED